MRTLLPFLLNLSKKDCIASKQSFLQSLSSQKQETNNNVPLFHGGMLCEVPQNPKQSKSLSSLVFSLPSVWWVLIFFSLAGCASVTTDRVPCPRTLILAEFSKSIDFHKGVPIRSDFDSVIPECTTDGLQTLVDFRLRITSIRPLASFNNPMTIKPSYFVAVIDKAGNVLSRSNHDLVVKFEEKQTTKVSFVRLEESVALGRGAAIYIGFNLDETQLDFLRKERNKHMHD